MVTLRSQRETGKSVPPEAPGQADLEFCKYMSYGHSWEKLVLPDKFGSALMGRELREVKLRVAGGGEQRAWDVEVVADEYGDVYLAGGWWEFARTNGLELGQLLFFRYDGVALITIRVLEGKPSPDQDEEEDGAEGNSSPPAPAPAPAPAPMGSESSNGGGDTADVGTVDPASSQFIVMLKECHFGLKQHQYLHVPADFHKAHGYTERRRVVLQMRGKSWTVNLKHTKLVRSGRRRTALRYGWHQFCVDNGLGLGDTCFFHALPEGSGEDHVLRVEVRKQDGTIVK
ncbi:B3 domain-containing protein Os03g0212300 [Lolium perenne]|uniref:B3 domain-containing protein Os03g0212300 n=1 Tax=Lolium perenne TaxID=4522 RepID=UPI0021F6454B|nr:B3 domain-containing protein Os03g0212300-like [Lolium perenne]